METEVAAVQEYITLHIGDPSAALRQVICSLMKPWLTRMRDTWLAGFKKLEVFDAKLDKNRQSGIQVGHRQIEHHTPLQVSLQIMDATLCAYDTLSNQVGQLSIVFSKMSQWLFECCLASASRSSPYQVARHSI